MLTPEIIQEFQRLLRDNVEEVPEGWMTVQQIAKQWGLGHCQAARNVRRLVEMGKLSMQPFRVKSGQRTLKIPHYRVEE